MNRQDILDKLRDLPGLELDAEDTLYCDKKIVMDSLAFLKLMTLIEQTFHISIDDEDWARGGFASVSSLLDSIQKQSGRSLNDVQFSSQSCLQQAGPYRHQISRKGMDIPVLNPGDYPSNE